MAIKTETLLDNRLTQVLHESLYQAAEYDWSQILTYIQDNFRPEEIYDRGELDEWALTNDYVKAAPEGG